MVEKIQALRGMNDILPDKSSDWRYVENIIIKCMDQYGYQEIRLPILEDTQLFKRSIGEVTDIVEKEMYTFDDLNGQSVSLRPEGTAGCLRACLEHGLLHNQQQKLWYIGPMFRHEKPQKGRYRQHTQFGVETLGIEGIAIELELLAIIKRIMVMLGLDSDVSLEINTLGEVSERREFAAKLVNFLSANEKELDEDSKRRLTRNPLRILDSKNPYMLPLIKRAPKLIDTISAESKNRFSKLCRGLEDLGIAYNINPLLVRGLDYYEHTVFEWVSDKLGSQGTISAGGFYAALLVQLAGNRASAAGFAIGLERLMLLLNTLAIPLDKPNQPALFIIPTDDLTMIKALQIAEHLRDLKPSWLIITNTIGGSLKSQFKKADKSGAQLALIIGSNEFKEGAVSVKNLRNAAIAQIKLPENELLSYLEKNLSVQ